MSVSLSEPDAKVYVYLALKGPTKAENIVDSLKMSRQQTYSSLKYLQDKGVVFPDSKKRGAFSALLFEKALELLIETEKEKAEILKDTKRTLLQDWKASTGKNSANC